MAELEDAIRLANAILDRPYGDPDDDLALLSRQLLRSIERNAAAVEAALGNALCEIGNIYTTAEAGDYNTGWYDAMLQVEQTLKALRARTKQPGERSGK